MTLNWLLQDASSPGQWLTGLANGSNDLCSPRGISLPEMPSLSVLSLEASSREIYTFEFDPLLGGSHEAYL